MTYLSSCSSVSAGVRVKTSSLDTLRGLLNKIPKSRKYSRTNWSTASRQRLRTTLQVPFIRGFYFSKLRAHKNARSVYNNACFYCCLPCVVFLIYCYRILVRMTTRGHCGAGRDPLISILYYFLDVCCLVWRKMVH